MIWAVARPVLEKILVERYSPQRLAGEFRKRRDILVDGLNGIDGVRFQVPDGAFYCMVDAAPLMSRFGDDGALAMHLLDHGVAVVQASAFGGRDGFRISFAADEAKLEEALRRIAAAVA